MPRRVVNVICADLVGFTLIRHCSSQARQHCEYQQLSYFTKDKAFDSLTLLTPKNNRITVINLSVKLIVLRI